MGIEREKKGRKGNYDMVQGLHASMRKREGRVSTSLSLSLPLCVL